MSKSHSQIARVLVTLGLTATGWFGSAQVATYAHIGLPIVLQALLALGCGAAAWVSAGKAIGFASDCMTVPPAMAPGLNSSKKSAQSSKAPKPGKSLLGQAAPATAVGKLPAPASVTVLGKLVDTPKLKIETAEESDGSLKITVNTTGVSNSQFKGQHGLLTRLQGIPGVTWQRHTNLDPGKGVKQVIGNLPAGRDREAVATRLSAIGEAEKFQ